MIFSRLYIYAALALAISGSGFWFNAKLNENKRLKVELAAAELSRDTAIAGAQQYRIKNERQVKLISDYQVKLDEKQTINSQLERDVAAGRKRLSVRGASCSPASSTAASTSTTEITPQYNADFRSNLFYIRSGIIKLEENYALCLQVLQEDRRKAQNPAIAP